jgi:TetR/AcrR family transcriptional regulator
MKLLRDNMKENRSDATSEKLLSAAAKVFSAKGYAGTRLEDIALESGHTRGAISFLFKNKRNLFHQLAQGFFNDATCQINELMSSPLPPREKIENLLDYSFDIDENYYKLAIINIALSGEPQDLSDLPEMFKADHSKTLEMISETVEAGIQEGVFSTSVDAEFAAKAIFTFCRGLYGDLVNFFDGMPNEAIKQNSKKLFLSYLLS